MFSLSIFRKKSPRNWTKGMAFAGVFLTSCSGIPVPYQRPPAGTPLSERVEIYRRERATYGFWTGERIGGSGFGFFHNPLARFAEYCDASGDTSAATLARSGELGYWTGLGLGLAGTASSGVLYHAIPDNGWPTVDAFWLGWLSGIEAIDFSKAQAFEHANLDYNSYLKRDLGLPFSSFLRDTEPVSLDTNVAAEGGWMNFPFFVADSSNDFVRRLSGEGSRNVSEFHRTASGAFFQGMAVHVSTAGLIFGAGFRYFEPEETQAWANGASPDSTLSESVEEDMQCGYLSLGGRTHTLGSFRMAWEVELGEIWGTIHYSYSSTGNNGAPFHEYDNATVLGNGISASVEDRLEWSLPWNLCLWIGVLYQLSDISEMNVLENRSNFYSPSSGATFAPWDKAALMDSVAGIGYSTGLSWTF